jgi:hypothetical protein
MALVSLADCTGADQAPMSPELVVQVDYSVRAPKKNKCSAQNLKADRDRTALPGDWLSGNCVICVISVITAEMLGSFASFGSWFAS